MTINYLTADATNPQIDGNKIIAHICNDIGRWGKGFVLAISHRWKQPEAAYRNWYAERLHNDFGLGAIQSVQVEKELWVVNMIAQYGIKSASNEQPIRYQALEECLSKLTHFASSINASVHMPRIGCGLAGGNWNEIEPLIMTALCKQNIPVYIYDLKN